MLRLIFTILTFGFLVISPISCKEKEQERKIAAPEQQVNINQIGTPLKLYGKTLDNQDFNWEALRGKYVLVKFTSSSCAPCRAEIPGMRQAYQQYREKGFEIVSVYVFDKVVETKKLVAEERLPWLIISEDLTQKANQPLHILMYDIPAVPTMLLVDKDGKIIDTDVRSPKLQTRLAELFSATAKE
jgi:thiol-disulfide isomerase/thioredoxin